MAIDPATVKAAVTVTKLLADRETRSKTLALILAAILGPLLLLASILQILTMPYDALGQAFHGEELQHVYEMRADTDFTQLLGEGSADYQENYGRSFEDVVFSDGATEVVYYNQLDSRWTDTLYGKTGTIGRSGCGPTALAIIVSTLTGEHYDPVELAGWAVENGYRSEGTAPIILSFRMGPRHSG